jgi:hypothetical protein
MAALDIYDQYYLFINGKLMVESISLQTVLESDDQKVMTLVKGFAGITPSPDIRTVKVENAVPSTGFEFDFERAKKERWLVELRLQSGATGKTMTSKGFFLHVSVEAGVGKTLTVGFEFVGEPSIFA